MMGEVNGERTLMEGTNECWDGQEEAFVAIKKSRFLFGLSFCFKGLRKKIDGGVGRGHLPWRCG